MALGGGFKSLMSGGQVSNLSVGTWKNSARKFASDQLGSNTAFIQYVAIGGGGGGVSGGSSARYGSGGAGLMRLNVPGEYMGNIAVLNPVDREPNCVITLSTNYYVSIGAGGTGASSGNRGGHGVATAFDPMLNNTTFPSYNQYYTGYAAGGGCGWGGTTSSVSGYNYTTGPTFYGVYASFGQENFPYYIGSPGSQGTMNSYWQTFGVYGNTCDNQPYLGGGAAGNGGGAGGPGWLVAFNGYQSKTTYIEGSARELGRGGVDNTAGRTNSGDGGGGTTSTEGTGKNGGSGIVIVKYPATLTMTIAVGLTSSTSTVGPYKVTVITAGAGNVSWA